MKTAVLLFAVLLGHPQVTPVPDVDISTVLMESTFQILGPSATPGKLTCGTVFFLGKPSVSRPSKIMLVMVTAHHVLNEIDGDDATLLLRRRKPDATFELYPFTIKIRASGKQLWYKHPNADVAVMAQPLPPDAHLALVSTEAVSDDELIRKFELHPGDELLSLGYPYCKAGNDAGFAILRSGKIASYPLVPTDRYRSFLFDFQVYGGNSGGPVYFVASSRTYGGAFHVHDIHFVVGLVSQQADANGVPLQIAVVVPASYIKAAVAALPEPHAVHLAHAVGCPARSFRLPLTPSHAPADA